METYDMVASMKVMSDSTNMTVRRHVSSPEACEQLHLAFGFFGQTIEHMLSTMGGGYSQGPNCCSCGTKLTSIITSTYLVGMFVALCPTCSVMRYFCE